MGTLNFEDLIEGINKRLPNGLPGLAAHKKLVPPSRRLPQRAEAIAHNPKVAGVMALLYPIAEKPHLVFTLRQDYPGVHSGQISFPGGKQEPGEGSTWETAKREAFEEVYLHPDAPQLIAPLTSLYIPVSNFLVDPYLAFVPARPDFVAEAAEVKQILEVPLHAFFHPDALTQFEVPGYKNAFTPCFQLEEMIIWGATAMIVNEIIQLSGGQSH